MLEHVEAVRAVAAQFRCERPLLDRMSVRLEESRIHLDRRTDAERGLHQITGGQTLECAEVARALRGGLLKAFDGALGAFLRTAAREVPAFAHQLVGSGDDEAVAHLGSVDDPATVFTEHFLDLADGDVNGMS